MKTHSADEFDPGTVCVLRWKYGRFEILFPEAVKATTLVNRYLIQCGRDLTVIAPNAVNR